MRNIFIKGIVLAGSGMLFLSGCSTGHEGEAVQESYADQGVTRRETSGQEASEQKGSEQESLEQDSSEQVTVEKELSEHLDSDAAADQMSGDGVPAIKITQDRKEWYTDDGEVLLIEAEASKVEVVSEGFDALKASFAGQWNGLNGYDNENLEWAKEHYSSIEKEEYSYFPAYAVSEYVQIYRLDNRVVSLCEDFGEYSGGAAHGFYGNNGRTFDVESGEELQLGDILSDPEEFYDKAIEYILTYLEEKYGEELFTDYEETVRTDTFGETPASWHLDNKGIVIDYALYEVTPYAAGTPSVTLSYDEFAEYIKEDYLMPCNSLVARVDVNEDFSDLIGETGKVMLATVYSYEDSATEVTVLSGNASETIGTFVRIGWDSYVIRRADGRSFLVFYCDYASDDFVTYVYEVTGGNVRFCDKLDGAEWSGTCTGTDRIGLSMHLDVLGTYAGDMIYQLTEDGKLVQTEEDFTISTSQSLTVIKELPVTIDGTATTIPVGSKIKITGTDNAGKACFQMVPDDGKTGVIQYVRDDEMWQILIDGVSENEYFEMVPYAG